MILLVFEDFAMHNVEVVPEQLGQFRLAKGGRETRPRDLKVPDDI